MDELELPACLGADRVMRMAVEGDPGIRGPTGNKEGWRETIPLEFRDFTETVFSDSVLRRAARERPGFECTITIREGEVLTKHNPYKLPPDRLRNLKRLLDSEEDGQRPRMRPQGPLSRTLDRNRNEGLSTAGNSTQKAGKTLTHF